MNHDIANARYQIALARESDDSAVRAMAQREAGVTYPWPWSHSQAVAVVAQAALAAKEHRVEAVTYLLRWVQS